MSIAQLVDISLQKVNCKMFTPESSFNPQEFLIFNCLFTGIQGYRFTFAKIKLSLLWFRYSLNEEKCYTSGPKNLRSWNKNDQKFFSAV